MKLIYVLGLVVFLNGCAEAGKVLNKSINNVQYSTNGFTANNYVGLTEEQLRNKITSTGKTVELSNTEKLIYGTRRDAYLVVNKKVERAYEVSDVSYEVKLASLGNLSSKSKSISFVNVGDKTEDISFKSTIEPIKNLLKFKGYNVVENGGAIVVAVNYGSKKSLDDVKNLDPAFYKVAKSKDTYLRFLDLEAKEGSSVVWKYKAVSEGSKPAVEPAVAAMVFAGYNEIPKNTLGSRVVNISETDPVLELVKR